MIALSSNSGATAVPARNYQPARAGEPRAPTISGPKRRGSGRPARGRSHSAKRLPVVDRDGEGRRGAQGSEGPQRNGELLGAEEGAMKSRASPDCWRWRRARSAAPGPSATRSSAAPTCGRRLTWDDALARARTARRAAHGTRKPEQAVRVAGGLVGGRDRRRRRRHVVEEAAPLVVVDDEHRARPARARRDRAVDRGSGTPRRCGCRRGDGRRSRCRCSSPRKRGSTKATVRQRPGRARRRGTSANGRADRQVLRCPTAPGTARR